MAFELYDLAGVNPVPTGHKASRAPNRSEFCEKEKNLCTIQESNP